VRHNAGKRDVTATAKEEAGDREADSEAVGGTGEDQDGGVRREGEDEVAGGVRKENGESAHHQRLTSPVQNESH